MSVLMRLMVVHGFSSMDGSHQEVVSIICMEATCMEELGSHVAMASKHLWKEGIRGSTIGGGSSHIWQALLLDAWLSFSAWFRT